MSYSRISLAIAGKRVEYQIEELSPDKELGQHDCPKDRGELAHVCSIVQYGFEADMHLVFCVCMDCGQRTVFKQVIPFHVEVKHNDTH